MLRSLLAKLNDEVLTTSYVCTYLFLRLKLFLHIRTPIFWQYHWWGNMLPPENLIFFSILPRAKMTPPGLTLSWRRPLSYRNQTIDLRSKSVDWFLYDNGLSHERVKGLSPTFDSNLRKSKQINWFVFLRKGSENLLIVN